MINTNQVYYTGLNLTYIGVTTNQTLDIILGEINTAVNNLNPSPNYSSFNYGPYNGYTVTTTTGGVPATAQQFVEGISKIVDIDQYNLNNFITVTYAANQSTFTTAINGLQTPGVTYSPYSITNTMTVTQTWNALFSGLTGTITSIDPYTANWSTLSITPSHAVVTTWNNVITYLSTLASSVAGKQAQISTFNNTGNCLAGGATDSIFTTVGELITYTCNLPSYSGSSITWGGVTSEITLQNSVQSIVNSVNTLLETAVVSNGTGLNIAAVGSTYQGKVLSINTQYTQLYKVMLSTDTYSNAGFLDSKITSTGGTITATLVDNALNLEVTTPATPVVAVNSSDTQPGYLQSKIPSTAGTWGIALASTPSADNSQLLLTPNVNNPYLFITNLLNYVQSDPELQALWCQVNNTSCTACACTAPTALVVTLNYSSAYFIMTWTIGGSPVSQVAQYRAQGTIPWITNVNIVPANPETNTATTVQVNNLSTNQVYQFQVLSTCIGGIGQGNIVSGIIYSQQTVTAVVNSSIISVNQNPIPTVNTITYQLVNSQSAVLQTISATGAAPQASFATAASGTYSIKYAYTTNIDGGNVNSYDSGQHNAWYSLTGVVVP